MDDQYECSQLTDDELGLRIEEDKAKAEAERKEKVAHLKKVHDFVWKGGMC